MTAYYNENEPFAAAWLRNLIAAGHVAPGVVDERSIEDVEPVAFAQQHFFAGVGGWSLALRRAGWPDDRPVWTASLPCQPFSAAGKRKGFDDKRHLWPTFSRLVRECRPERIIGEQVSSPDGLAWLDVVSLDLEDAGYAVGAIDICAASVGAPHRRHRLYWTAERLDDTAAPRHEPARSGKPSEPERRERVPGLGCEVSGLGDASGARLEVREGVHPRPGEGQLPVCSPAPSGAGGMGDAEKREQCGIWEPGSPRRPEWETGRPGGAGGMGVPDRSGRGEGRLAASASGYGRAVVAAGGGDRPGPVNGFWSGADWLRCRDGKWRPTEPTIFPLATGVRNRVGTLCGSGNAINIPTAEAFIRCIMEG